MLKTPGSPEPTPCLPIVSHHCLWLVSFPGETSENRVVEAVLLTMAVIHGPYLLLSRISSSLAISLIALRSSCDLTTNPFIYHVPFQSWLQKVFNHSVDRTLVL